MKIFDKMLDNFLCGLVFSVVAVVFSAVWVLAILVLGALPWYAAYPLGLVAIYLIGKAKNEKDSE